jgi:hypothetical protein
MRSHARREQLRTERHELAARAIVRREQLALTPRRGDPRRDRVHQERIGPRILEDALLAIADPHGAPGERVQLHEQRQLDGARVLKLVDQRKLQPSAELCANRCMIEQAQGAVEHVHVVDDATLPLPLGVGAETDPGSFEEREGERSDIRVELGVALVVRRDLVEHRDRGLAALAGLQGRELGPVAPIEFSIATALSGETKKIHGLVRLLGAIADLEQSVVSDPQLSCQCFVQGLAVRSRRPEQR